MASTTAAALSNTPCQNKCPFVTISAVSASAARFKKNAAEAAVKVVVHRFMFLRTAATMHTRKDL
jgi:hypothetical protein